MKAAPLSLELARARPAHGALGAALRRAWAAPRSAQTIVLFLAAWLVLVGNLALWRSVFALESGRGGMLVCLGIAVLLVAALAALLAPTAWGRRMKPLWLLVLFLAAVAQHFMLDFGAVLIREGDDTRLRIDYANGDLQHLAGRRR